MGGNKNKLTPIAHGKVISLRPFTPTDITPKYLSWLHDPEVVKFSNQRFATHTQETSRKYLETFKDSSNLFLAIVERESRETVGSMTAYVSEPHGTADMGILLGNRKFWGKGLGLDAWSTLMNYLFQENKLRKITGGTVKSNQAMVRIMEKSDMTLEGVRVRQMVYDGQEEDIVLYGKFRG